MRKFLYWLERIIQIYIPMACFIVLFSVFNIQIILRYVFKSPTIWSSEVSGIMFLWLVMLSTNYTTKCNKHVCFTMVYDFVNETKKTVIRILGNFLIVGTYSIGLIPCFKAIINDNKLSSTLRLPMKYIYFPFIIFILFTIGYSVAAILQDIKLLVKSHGKSENKEVRA